MNRNYKFHNKLGAYFVSFATVNWIDVFTRQIYFDVLAESIDYYRIQKTSTPLSYRWNSMPIVLCQAMFILFFVL